jgi:TPR repeat protein
MSNLGGMYANGTGVDKNEAEAVRLARKAAEAGDAHGMSGLGVMYENGEGVTKDPAQALSWYQQAAAMGDEYAKSAVKRISPQSATSP